MNERFKKVLATSNRECPPENKIVESTNFPSVDGCGTYDIGWPVVTMSGQARPGGLEPPTCGLEDRCSIQLSYGRKGLWGHKFY